MRKLMLGMLLAAGAALPTMAMADTDVQDRPPEAGQHHDHGGGGGGQPHQPRPPEQARPAAPAPQPHPQPAPQVHAQMQAQAQAPMQARGGPGGFHGAAGAHFNGDPRHFDHGGDRPSPPGAPQPGYRPQGGSQFAPGSGAYQPQGGPQVAPGSGGYRPQGGPQVVPGSGGYRPQGRPQFAPGSGGYRPQGDHGYRPAPPPPGPGGSWNRGWRGNGQFNYTQYRVQNNYIYRLPRYYAPSGWGYGYRRFSPGITLSAVLFAENYWIGDPYYYRLPPAYGPYRWVRYYNDALLIDVRNGMVVDVVHDIFW